MARKKIARRVQPSALLVVFFVALWLGFQLRCSVGSGNLHYLDDEVASLTPSSSNNFNLAYEQSYGFFDSISDVEWKMRQEWARNSTFRRYMAHPRRQWDEPNLWYYNNYEYVK
jgi:hypothetical protein